MSENKVKKMMDHINPQKAPARRKESSQHLPKQKQLEKLPSLGRSNTQASAATKETLSEKKSAQ
jgi:hypothetical protein